MSDAESYTQSDGVHRVPYDEIVYAIDGVDSNTARQKLHEWTDEDVWNMLVFHIDPIAFEKPPELPATEWTAQEWVYDEVRGLAAGYSTGK
ncbi:hypothetical protein JCM10207_006554 [Rhodosporidiobolus poonsookiae]